MRHAKKGSSRKSKSAPRSDPDTVSTDGVDVSELSMSENLQFSAWDFAGQQVSRRIHKILDVLNLG